MWHIIYFIIECGVGYTEKKGSLTGGGLVGGIFEYSLFQCKRRCDLREDCNSFMFSAQRRHCKIQAELLPVKNDNYQDFTWCSQGVCHYVNE